MLTQPTIYFLLRIYQSDEKIIKFNLFFLAHTWQDVFHFSHIQTDRL